MAERQTLWLARVENDRRPQTLRCSTGGAPPGPSQAWEPIADPFVAARIEDDDVVAVARRAAAIGDAAAIGGRELLAPVEPTKILAIGRNYAAHAKELGNEVPTSPLSFFKPPSCLVPSGRAVELPRGYARIDMEAELVVVIGRRAKAVAAADVYTGGHVGGYLLGNDISNRDLQRSDKQWTRAKGFDGFGPVSAFLRLDGRPLDAARLRIRGYLDDVRVQDGAVSAMIFEIPILIEHLSACMTLEPGDLIFTGTPEGVTALDPGKVTRVELASELDGFALAPVVTPLT